MTHVIKGDRATVLAAITYIAQGKEDLRATKYDARNRHMEPFVNTVIDRKPHTTNAGFSAERLSLPLNHAPGEKSQVWVPFDPPRDATRLPPNPLRSETETDHPY